MADSDTYAVTVLLDVNDVQDVDDRAESRTYLVADRTTGEALIIDSVIENVDRDLALVRELGLTLVFVLETHIHADHITGASMIQDRTGARIVYGAATKGTVMGADEFMDEGQCLSLGHTVLTALSTPGHTEGCMSYVLPGAVFTGDALFIRGNGRTDFQGGSPERLFHSVRTKLFVLPDDTIVYPGHDYHGRVSSTIGEEKRFNERLNLSISEDVFVDMMKRRKTPRPAKMDIALPANMRAGRVLDGEAGIGSGFVA
ncbi:Zn-dependent hydrolase [Nitrospira sp.]|nr:Zn-dependent hydrolase [Nitrospira sp.]